MARSTCSLVKTSAAGAKPEARAAMAGGAEIGGQDDQAVAEIGDLAERVGQPAVVEHLQEQVPDARMGLLELVQQDDRERLLAHAADQRVGFAMADAELCRGSC